MELKDREIILVLFSFLSLFPSTHTKLSQGYQIQVWKKEDMIDSLSHMPSSLVVMLAVSLVIFPAELTAVTLTKYLLPS